MITEDMVTPVGRIYKPHSYKGELNVEFDYDILPDSIDTEIPFLIKIDGILVPFFVQRLRGGQGNAFIKFKDIDSDSDAGILTNRDLYMLKTDLASLLGVGAEEIDAIEEGLIGFKVVDLNNNQFIGYVEDIEEGIEYDYLAVKTTENDRIVEIPLIDEFIAEIEETSEDARGVIRVSLPEGFLEI